MQNVYNTRKTYKKIRKMSTISDKSLIINEIKKYYKIDSDAEFARYLGIKPQTLNSWRVRNTLDYDLLSAKCVDINMDWIIRGAGDMLKSKKIESNAYEIGRIPKIEESNIEYNSNNQFIDLGNGYYQMLVPLIGHYAYGGYLTGFSDTEFIEELPKFPIIVKKQHKGIYRAFNVRGESMNNNTSESIIQGDVAIGRRVEKEYWKSKLHLTKWQDFVIVHQDGILIKRIIDHNVETGIITCESLNQDKDFYPNLKIHLTEVNELFNIIQIVRIRN